MKVYFLSLIFLLHTVCSAAQNEIPVVASSSVEFEGKEYPLVQYGNGLGLFLDFSSYNNGKCSKVRAEFSRVETNWSGKTLRLVDPRQASHILASSDLSIADQNEGRLFFIWNEVKPNIDRKLLFRNEWARLSDEERHQEYLPLRLHFFCIAGGLWSHIGTSETFIVKSNEGQYGRYVSDRRRLSFYESIDYGPASFVAPNSLNIQQSIAINQDAEVVFANGPSKLLESTSTLRRFLTVNGFLMNLPIRGTVKATSVAFKVADIALNVVEQVGKFCWKLVCKTFKLAKNFARNPMPALRQGLYLIALPFGGIAVVLIGLSSPLWTIPMRQKAYMNGRLPPSIMESTDAVATVIFDGIKRLKHCPKCER